MAARPNLEKASSSELVNWLASSVRRLGNRLAALEARSKPDIGVEKRGEVGGITFVDTHPFVWNVDAPVFVPIFGASVATQEGGQRPQ
eukprot:4681393-Alexandrium_andersonii.AAC.1